MLEVRLGCERYGMALVPTARCCMDVIWAVRIAMYSVAAGCAAWCPDGMYGIVSVLC